MVNDEVKIIVAGLAGNDNLKVSHLGRKAILEN
jgi:hypothetical protein